VTTLDLTNLEVTNIKAKDGTASASIADSTGVMTITNLAGTTANITNVNATTVDATNVEASNIKAKDGTAAITIADSTGAIAISKNLTIGDASTDTLTVTSTVTSNLIFTDNTYDIGASGATRPRNLYLSGDATIGGSVIATTLDLTNLEVTNIKAKDGTASASIADSTGIFTHSTATVFTAGTVSLPAITTTGDTNTGIFFPAADTIAFTEGGVESMRIDSSGNVGIGITPTYRLDVAQSGATTTTSAFAMARITGANATANDLTLIGPNTSQVRIKFGDPDDAGVGEVGYNNSTNAMRFNTNGAERMTIDSSGNLGLGVSTNTNPNTAKLMIQYESTVGTVNSHIALVGDSATNGQGPQILFSESGVGQNFAGGTIGFVRTGSNSIGDLVFGTRATAGDATTTTTERMRITSAGNVGIGTSSPASKLDIQGTGSQTLSINRTDAAVAGALNLIAGNNGNVIECKLTKPLLFTLNDAERMRLDSSGNLGLGVTPSAWASFSAFQFGENGCIAANDFGTDNAQVILGNNTFYDGSYKYIATGDSATRYQQAAGSHIWYTAPSGTAGNAITFTQAMTLDASGRLLLGTTSTRSGLAYMQTTEGGNIAGNITVRNTADSGGPVSILAKSRGTTVGSVTVVAANDVLGTQLFYGTDGTGLIPAASIFAAVDGTPGTNDMPGRLVFSTTADGAAGVTERMRIDSAGNMGLGITPSAWLSTNLKALQVGTGYMYSATNSSNLDIGSNAVYDATTTYKYISNGFSSRYQQVSGIHSWHTAPSGTAGNAVTFTQAMTLNASGNLGIGTTTINARLHVTEDNKVFDGYGNVNVFSSTATATDAGGAIAFGGRNSQGTDPFVFGKIKGAKEAGGTWNGYLAFGTTAGSSAVTERMRITSDGYLRMASGSLGIQFNGDTAAANSLDDYEEGTCTIRLSDGTTSTGGATMPYVKIGRVVSVVMQLYGLNTTGFNTAAGLFITGLPFAINSGYNLENTLNTPKDTCSPLMCEGGAGATQFALYAPGSGALNWLTLTLTLLGASAGASSTSVYGTITYLTN
jgi:hypothetical protein